MNPRSVLRGAIVSATVLALAFAMEALALGSGPSPAAIEPSTSPQPPSVLPGEPWIVRQWQTSTGDYGLYLVRPDGSGDHLILTASGGGYVHPDWSPDGSQLVFGVAGAYDAIWTANADGSDAKQIVTCVSPCSQVGNAAWSPDGRQIVFWRADADAGAAQGVFTTTAVDVLDLAGGARRTVLQSKDPEYFMYPRWSPDGASLVVEIQRYPPGSGADADETGSAIAIADISGPGLATPRLLTDWADHAANPDWSPIDDRIVFSTYALSYWEKSDQPSNLFTIKSDGTGLTQLTHYGEGEIRDTQPTWTPDGKRIIFTQVGTEHVNGYRMPREVAFIDADGTNLQVMAGVGGTHPRLRPTP